LPDEHKFGSMVSETKIKTHHCSRTLRINSFRTSKGYGFTPPQAGGLSHTGFRIK